MWRCLLSDSKLHFTPFLLSAFYVVSCDEEDFINVHDNEYPLEYPYFDVSNIPIVNFPTQKELEYSLNKKRALNIIIHSKKAEEER